MGTIKKLINKILHNVEETDEKVVVKTSADIKHPKDKKQRAFMPQTMFNPFYGVSVNPEFHPKRTKLKGWQKNNMRKNTYNKYKKYA